MNNFFTKSSRFFWMMCPNIWPPWGRLSPTAIQKPSNDWLIRSKESWVTWEFRRSHEKHVKWKSSGRSQMFDLRQASTRPLSRNSASYLSPCAEWLEPSLAWRWLRDGQRQVNDERRRNECQFHRVRAAGQFLRPGPGGRGRC